jgi:hypothetical protein
MSIFKPFGVALGALFAVAAVMSTSAFALPTLLVGNSERQVTYTDRSNGETILEPIDGGMLVECVKVFSEGTTEASKPSGLFHIHFKECKGETDGVSAPCTGEGEESGAILVLGSYHLVYDTLKALLSEAGVAILFLVGTANFSCASGLVSVEVRLGGMVLCLILNPTVLTKTFEFHCKAVATGRPEESKYYNAAGTLVSIGTLLISLNGGTPTEAAQVGAGFLEFPEDVLIMI